MVKLAMLISGAEGDYDPQEAAVVKGWIQRTLAATPDRYRETHKQALNAAVREIYGITDRIKLEWLVNDITDELVELLEQHDRYEVLELLLRVAQADGVTAQEEFDMLNRIADWLEVDLNEYRSMRDKSLRGTTRSGFENNEKSDWEMIGVSDQADAEEKRRRLNEEFKKWNSRSNSSDPEVKKQAEEMKERLGKLRKTLSNR